MKKSRWLILPILALIYISFQNCGGSFSGQKSISSDQGSNINNPPTAPSPGPAPAPAPTPAPAPSPPPVGIITKTRVYFGSSGPFIYPIEINSATDQVTKLPAIAVTLQSVGWMNYDPMTKFFLTVDASAPGTLLKRTYDPLTGSLTQVSSTNNINGVHSSLIKGAQQSYLYVANYGEGQLKSYSLSNTFDNVTTLATIDFPLGAKTHSSALDAKRNILFVANLGLDQFAMYDLNLANGVLVPNGTFNVADPRTVVYDAQFDKLYVVTESSVANLSRISGYSIAVNNGLVVLNRIATLPIPLLGGDLKVDHTHNFVMATARQNNQESIWAMPVTATGVDDNTRMPFQIQVNKTLPRCLEVSADGKYVIVGMTSQQPGNAIVYKMTYDQNHNFVSAVKIFEDTLGTGCLSSVMTTH